MSRIIILIASLLSLGATTPAQSRTWNVYDDGAGDAPTIDAALDSIATGDTILVHPGTYEETPQKAGLGEVTLIGVGGSERTIILPASSAVYFNSDSIHIEGITFQGGTWASIQANLMTVRRCAFIDLSYLGPNLWLEPRDDDATNVVRFEENIVRDNESERATVLVENAASVRSNVFIDNIINMPNPNFSGALLVEGHSASIEKNLFISNEGGSGAAALASYFMSSSETLEIRNNVFYDNYAAFTVLTPTVAVLLERNVFSKNTAWEAIVPYCASFEPQCNIFWQNVTFGYACTFEESNWNLSADPEFCAPDAEDFLVSFSSICLPENQPEGMDCGLIGVFDAGCPVSVQRETWGQIKARYRR